jgi:hypothetical protein
LKNGIYFDCAIWGGVEDDFGTARCRSHSEPSNILLIILYNFINSSEFISNIGSYIKELRWIFSGVIKLTCSNTFISFLDTFFYDLLIQECDQIYNDEKLESKIILSIAIRLKARVLPFFSGSSR